MPVHLDGCCRIRQAGLTTYLHTGFPLALKPRNAFAEIVQSYQKSHPARNVFGLQAKRFGSPASGGVRLVFENDLCRCGNVQKMGQEPMSWFSALRP